MATVVAIGIAGGSRLYLWPGASCGCGSDSAEVSLSLSRSGWVTDSVSRAGIAIRKGCGTGKLVRRQS